MVRLAVEGKGDFAYSFLGSPTEVGSFVFLTFGVKQIVVNAQNETNRIQQEFELPVIGIFRPVFESREFEHNARWTPVTKATILASGQYDEVRGFLGDETVFSIEAAESYAVPIPFVGARRFEIALYHRDTLVTDRVAVEIVGLNSPPSRPRFDGSALLGANAGETIRFEIEATDPNSDPLLFDARPLPQGASIVAETGEFEWTPGDNQVGYFLINFYVYDNFETKTGFVQRTILVAP